MKTSYKLLIVGMLLLFGTTAAMDFAYKRVYKLGDYKDPYASYDTKHFKNFDTIEIVAANLIQSTIKQSDKFDVKIHKWAEGAEITQKGSRLIITFDANQVGYSGSYKDALLIECPVLKEIRTDARFTVNGITMVARKKDVLRYEGGRIYLEGFKQDSLSIVMNNFSQIHLNNNQLKFLNANIGSQDSSMSTISINRSNQVASANLDLQQHSVVTLRDIFIPDFKYKLSDSAEVNLSGISLRLLQNR